LRRPFANSSANAGRSSPVKNPGGGGAENNRSSSSSNNSSRNSPNPSQQDRKSPNSNRNSPKPASRKSSASPNRHEDAVEDEEEDPELASLRCKSIQTEEIVSQKKEKQEREKRRNRCADYPGFAFGSAMFGSDTTMKFNIIKNELHNIMKSQLRRVDGEVAALSQRIKDLDVNLAKSEQYIKTSTVALAEAVQWELDNRKESQEEEREENALSQFDAQLKLLEGQLLQARMLTAQVSSDYSDEKPKENGEEKAEEEVT
jgi:tropomyosin-1